MTLYPFPEALQGVSQTMITGNFGLWCNKFIPLSNACKPADERGNETMPVEHYFTRYGQMKHNAVELLKRKHNNMSDYCASFPSEKYEIVNISAMLVSPFITGIGESHPHEVSMVFDHNLGIPYIPASGIKGIVRFVHTLALIPEAYENGAVDEKGFFDDEDTWTLVPMMFGTQKKRGRVVFLDAYPEKVPDLHIDIMNPHYGPYYSDGMPPADHHHNPTPIKFLTIAKGTSFIFRAVAEKKENLPERVKIAFVKALAEEGVGAKTAVGYGRFEITSSNEEKQFLSSTESNSKDHTISSLLETWCERLKHTKPNDAGPIGSIINSALEELKSDEEKREFAMAVKNHIGKDFKKSKAKKKLENFFS